MDSKANDKIEFEGMKNAIEILKLQLRDNDVKIQALRELLVEKHKEIEMLKVQRRVDKDKIKEEFDRMKEIVEHKIMYL